MELILSIFIGIGLAAAVGFRIFIPFLIASIAAYTGNLELSAYFGWIGTLPALILFAVATVVEIFSYYICLLYTSPSPRDRTRSRMPSSA